MKFKGALGMTIALAAIGSYYYFVDIPKEKKKKEEKEQSEKIILFDEKKLTNLTLSSNDSKISLKKEENNWTIEKPFKAKSDVDTINDLLKTLKNAKYNRIIDEKPKDLTSFGLKIPKLTIALKFKEKGTIKVLIGDDSPIGSSLYIKLGDRPSVFLSSLSLNSLNKSIYELRDKTILDFSTGSISKINIERKETKISFEKKDDDWFIKSGELNSKAEKSEVNNLLSAINVDKIKSFVEENPKGFLRFGLEKPSIKITLIEKGSTKQHTLLIGAKKDDTYYARNRDSKNIFSLETNLVNKFLKNPLNYLNKKLFNFIKDDVTKFELTIQEKTIEVVKESDEEEEWKLEKPIQTETDTATINSLFFDLSDAQVLNYVIGNAKSLDPYGLDSPKKSFTLSFQNKNKQTLVVGKETTVPETFFAMRSGESSIFTVKKDSLDKIFRTLHDLRNKSLVSLKMDRATKIELKYPDKTFELISSGDDWTLTKPEKVGDMKSFKARDILWTLNNLEFAETVETTLTEEITELNKPKLEINIWDKDNNQLAQVKVGKKTNDSLYYALVKGKTSVYKIKKRFLDEIPSKLEDFKPIEPSSE